ncbi:T9SS type A sorting domain-containing protein [bacterium]|nr:T9SS type A sorting domain-containing protein [bacterium]MBU1984333.1 T9SS type A sorting domain-containing protein [bacterium]
MTLRHRCGKVFSFVGKTVRFCLAGMALLLAAEARADWSPEIVVWENPPEVLNAGPVNVSMVPDSQGRLHVVYQHAFYLPSGPPPRLRSGLNYVQYDDWGNRVVGPVFLTDSLDLEAWLPRLSLLGSDSVLVAWCWQGNDPGEYPGYKTRTLDVFSGSMGSPRYWTRAWPGYIDGFASAVRGDGTFVLAYPAHWSEICAIVEIPDGERIMDETVIWAREGNSCDYVGGFVDQHDSLQLVWRQRNSGDPVFTKRVDISSPFDTLQRTTFFALTPDAPGDYYAFPRISPIGDSLLAFIAAYPEDMCTDYLHILERQDYEERARYNLGGCSDVAAAVEPDSTLSIVNLMRADRSLHFRRFSIPGLDLISDTVVARVVPPALSLGFRDYAVSPQGVRHLMYVINLPGANARLVYRFWREDLGTHERESQMSDFSISITPNPTTGPLFISGPLERVKEVAIFNILGQRVFLARPQPGVAPMVLPSLSSLPNGSYFLHVTTRASTHVYRVLVIH